MTRMFFALSLGFLGVILATQIAFTTPQADIRHQPAPPWAKAETAGP